MKRSIKVYVGGMGLLIIFLLCLLLPWIYQMDAQGVYLKQRLLPPSSHNLFGTDYLGRNQVARLLEGGLTTLSLTLIAVVASSSIGVCLGVLSGYCGGLVDCLIGWVMDTLLAFPNMILALGIAGLLGPSLHNILVSVIFVNWVGYAKLTRTITRSIKCKPYVRISRLCGASHVQLLRKHVLTNLIPYVSVMMSMDVGLMMLRIAGLSFLGLGATALQPEWGMMVQEARRYMSTAPWLLLIPSAAIMLTVTCANLLGIGLREGNRRRGWQ